MANISTGPSYQFIGSEELQREIELLKFYPEIFQKHFKPALTEAAEAVKDKIRPLLPHRRTGRLEKALGSKIIGGTSNEFSSRLGYDSVLGTRADIGFGKRYKMPSAMFAAALSQGSKGHEVKAHFTSDKYLHFSSQGRFTTIGSMQHPGLAPLGFMEKGLEAAKPKIDSLFSAAAEQVVQELAKP